jgi:hypothetical protein
MQHRVKHVVTKGLRHLCIRDMAIAEQCGGDSSSPNLPEEIVARSSCSVDLYCEELDRESSIEADSVPSAFRHNHRAMPINAPKTATMPARMLQKLFHSLRPQEIMADSSSRLQMALASSVRQLFEPRVVIGHVGPSARFMERGINADFRRPKSTYFFSRSSRFSPGFSSGWRGFC